MRGKFLLNIESIDNTAPTTPGAYVLVNGSNNAVYVGRSDTDLNGRLKNHLPENESNVWIRRSLPTDFYFEPTTTELRINNENDEILPSVAVIARRHKVPTKQSQKREIASLRSQ